METETEMDGGGGSGGGEGGDAVDEISQINARVEDKARLIRCMRQLTGVCATYKLEDHIRRGMGDGPWHSLDKNALKDLDRFGDNREGQLALSIARLEDRRLLLKLAKSLRTQHWVDAIPKISYIFTPTLPGVGCHESVEHLREHETTVDQILLFSELVIDGELGKVYTRMMLRETGGVRWNWDSLPCILAVATQNLPILVCLRGVGTTGHTPDEEYAHTDLDLVPYVRAFSTAEDGGIDPFDKFIRETSVHMFRKCVAEGVV